MQTDKNHLKSVPRSNDKVAGYALTVVSVGRRPMTK
jgi:hypothetical protein